MKLLRYCLLGLLVSAVLAGPTTKPSRPMVKADAPEDVKAYYAKCVALIPTVRKERQRRLAELQKSLRDLKRNPADQAETIKRTQQSIEAAQADVIASNRATFLPDAPLGDLQVGRIGEVHQFDVVQILDKQSMIATPWYVDNSNTLIHSDETVYLEKFDTSGMADGRVVHGGAFKVVGTKRYETAAGASNTVMLLQPFRLLDYCD